jgi:shikimate dehydrogenase
MRENRARVCRLRAEIVTGAIDGETRLVALLGRPVAGSLSPRMQNAAFAARGLNWAYVAFDVPEEALEQAVRGLSSLGFAGANVTIPHKRAVAALCDELDPPAERAGSVNTLVFGDGRLRGSSTDGLAVTSAVTAKRAALFGAGGAAAAVRAELEQAGTEVRVFSRRGDWPPETDGADLIVNATPVTDELLVEPRADQSVVDLAYNADGTPTALVAAARAAGCETVVDGLEILVRQGAASFEQWTGLPAPVDVMRAALGLRA